MNCNTAEQLILDNTKSQELTDHLLKCKACQAYYSLLDHSAINESINFNIDIEISKAMAKADKIKKRNNFFSLISFMLIMIIIFSIILSQSDTLFVFLKLQGLITLIMPVLLLISVLKRKAVY
jgi:hypothetical protein